MFFSLGNSRIKSGVSSLCVSVDDVCVWNECHIVRRQTSAAFRIRAFDDYEENGSTCTTCRKCCTQMVSLSRFYPLYSTRLCTGFAAAKNLQTEEVENG